MILEYFDQVLEGVEFLMAAGSIVGILGFVFGLLLFLFSSSKAKPKFLGIMVGSLLLVALCGFNTGIKYFRLDLL